MDEKDKENIIDNLSNEMVKTMNVIVDKRVKELVQKENEHHIERYTRLAEKVDELADLIEKSLNNTAIEELSIKFKKIDIRTQNIQYQTTDDALEQKISKILLDLVPGFFDKIAKEVRKHIASIALFALENSKEPSNKKE